ncbi:MAG: PCRF domain-containing protein, partial [Phycisphaerales bacterium JB040]
MTHPADPPEALTAKLDELDAQLADIERAMSDPEVLADHRRATALAIRKAALEPVVSGYREYRDLCAEADELRAALTSDDAELAEIARVELPEIEARAAETLERVKAELVQSDDRRVGSVILEIRAGTGGDEAGLWA